MYQIEYRYKGFSPKKIDMEKILFKFSSQNIFTLEMY